MNIQRMKEEENLSTSNETNTHNKEKINMVYPQ